MANQDINNAVEVPWDVLDSCNGIALDIGGSTIKLLYIHVNDWLEPEQRKQTSKGRLGVRTFSHDALYDGTVYKFIKESVYIKRCQGNQDPVVCGTGLWLAYNGETINKHLTVRLECLRETECFIQALVYSLNYLPKDAVLYEHSQEYIQKVQAECTNILKAYTTLSTTKEATTASSSVLEPWFPVYDTNINNSPFVDHTDVFPCILVMCGSSYGYLCVQRDATYTIAHNSTRGGRMWLGLGSILTGGTNYDELMKLAEEGNFKNVDFCTNDMLKDVPSEQHLKDKNYYQQTMENVEKWVDEPHTIFSFGKGPGKTIDDFKKEDLARTLLNTMISDLVESTLLTSRLHNIKHVFFSGGFVDHPLVRSLIYGQFKRADVELLVYSQKNEPTQCYFLKNGQHYGALGALLNHKLKFLPIKD